MMLVCFAMVAGLSGAYSMGRPAQLVRAGLMGMMHVGRTNNLKLQGLHDSSVLSL